MDQADGLNGRTMDKNGLSSFLLGLGVGVGIGMLFAPKSERNPQIIRTKRAKALNCEAARYGDQADR